LKKTYGLIPRQSREHPSAKKPGTGDGSREGMDYSKTTFAKAKVVTSLEAKTGFILLKCAHVVREAGRRVTEVLGGRGEGT